MQVWGIPYRTHCAIVCSLINKGLCDRHMFLSRLANFALSASQINCDTLNGIVSCIRTSDCIFARNLRHLCEILNFNINFLQQSNKHAIQRIIEQCCLMSVDLSITSI